MEFRVLRYFLEVAREQSLTKAAATLHVSQPTLSKQLKDLERELGHKLFTRSNYGIVLTEEGMLLRRRADEIVSMVERTQGEFHALEGNVGGDVRIGCGESENIRHIARCARAVQERDPLVRVHLYSGNGEDLAERIESGMLDFAVLTRQADPARYNSLPLPGADTWGVIMRSDSALAEREALSVDDLVGLPLILSRQAMTDAYAQWFGERLDELHVVATYNLAYNASVLAREGIGYVVSFDRLVHTGPGSDLTFRPLTPALVTHMNVAWKKHQVFSHAAQLMLDEMQRAFGRDGRQLRA